MTRPRPLVVALQDADGSDATVLGGKGAGLAEMRSLGLPVPPGFVISTDVCRAFLEQGDLPAGVRHEIDVQIGDMAAAIGRRLGDRDAPLLVSVRSGAPVSMPGMMDTILNVGLCDDTIEGLVHLTADRCFAWDCYVRLLRSFGTSVRGIEGRVFDAARVETGSDSNAIRACAREFLDLITAESGRPFPQNPRAQLEEAVAAVFSSWQSPRARRYRKYAGIPDDLGTAVVVQAMVFGNLGDRSGTGVAFTRDPATGAAVLYGDFLRQAQGEDVVAGEHEVGPLEDCRAMSSEAWGDLEQALTTIERRRRDMCEIEFTVERGRLWILQSRAGQRTGTAAIRIALDLLDEGMIDAREAMARVSPAALSHLQDPVFDSQTPRELIGRGVAASPGAAAGEIALSPQAAERMTSEGIDVVLVRPFTSPDDIAGMIVSRGVVTSRGGRTSHAAVVARGMDRPAVCGVRGLEVSARSARFGETELREGDAISIDGTLGEVYRGRLPEVVPEPDPRIERLLRLCDAERRLPVLSEEGRAAWADERFDPTDAAVCTSDRDIERASSLGRDTRLVLDVCRAGDAAGLIREGLRAARDSSVPVFVRVDGAWPASVPGLPPGPWSGIVTTKKGSAVARRLAAFVSEKKAD